MALREEYDLMMYNNKFVHGLTKQNNDIFISREKKHGKSAAPPHFSQNSLVLAAPNGPVPPRPPPEPGVRPRPK